MRLEDESGHAEGGSGGTSNVHGVGGTSEVGRAGGRGTGTSARGHTLGLGGNGAVVVGSSDNSGSSSVRSRDGSSRSAGADDSARTIADGLRILVSIVVEKEVAEVRVETSIGAQGQIFIRGSSCNLRGWWQS